MKNCTPSPSLFDTAIADPNDPRLPEKFKSKFVIEDRGYETPCWIWKASKTGEYGSYGYDKKQYYAHRFSYERMVAVIPERLQIDHLCRNRGCVNPDHLEAVTQRVNLLRGQGTIAINSRKTHCIHGHQLSGDNLHVKPDGSRSCKTCDRMRKRKTGVLARPWRYSPELTK